MKWGKVQELELGVHGHKSIYNRIRIENVDFREYSDDPLFDK